MTNKGLPIAAVLIAAVVAAGLYGSRSSSVPAKPGISSPIPPPAAAIPSDLPMLEDSDGFVREQAAKLSEAPAFKTWLKLDSLVARVTSALAQLADGSVPHDTFAPFAPRGKFRVLKKDGRAVPDPASFSRYDAFAHMVTAVDAVAVARLFERLYPLFDAAQSGLGEAARPRAAFLAAVRPLMDAPVPEGETPLKEGKKGIVWAYTDEKLENLSPAQKQLLRMGPKNQKALQAKLLAVALALGGL